METIGDVGKARGKRPARFKVHERLRLDETDFVPRGFTGLRLVVTSFERLTDEQILLLEEEEAAGKEELDRLVERLRIKLGEEACMAVEAVESHVPERACQGSREGLGFRVQGLGKKEKKGKGAGLEFSSPEPSTLNPEPSLRPLHLLPMPCEIPVMVRPSHDRDVRRFRLGLKDSRTASFMQWGPSASAGCGGRGMTRRGIILMWRMR